MNPILEFSGSALGRMIADGELSALEVLDAHIARLEAVNPTLNALVFERLDHARDEARRLDASGPEAGARLFHGVPFSVAESLAVEGCPHTAGSVARGGLVADRDATAVARMRKAGGIAVGVSNTSELGFWVEASNRVYGRTSNPYDARRTSGGACGGDAALVASGCVPVAVVSDAHGGARIPAAFCGVYAHKPTGGMVPITGQYPVSIGKAKRYTTIASMARRAEDLYPMLQTMYGADGVDRATLPIELRDPARVDFTWKRVVISDELGGWLPRPQAAVRKALRRAARILAGFGAEVEEWQPAQFRSAGEIWLSMIHESFGLQHAFSDVVGEGRGVSVAMELARMALGRSRHTIPTLGFVGLERVTKGGYVRIQRFCAEGRRLRQRLNTVLGDGGLMLMPAYPTSAPKHRRTYREPMHMLYAAIHNVLEVPATTVPMSIGRDGLPVAIQVVAAHGRDDVCLAAAMALEAATGGWKPPTIKQTARA